MKLIQKITCIITLSTCMSVSAVAEDCGAPPMETPTLPSTVTITADTLKSARERTIAYSETVDTYMTCMDQRGRKLLPYLTKDQQTRWEEDLTEIHETRRQLQITLNDIIRAYRKQSDPNKN